MKYGTDISSASTGGSNLRLRTISDVDVTT